MWILLQNLRMEVNSQHYCKPIPIFFIYCSFMKFCANLRSVLQRSIPWCPVTISQNMTQKIGEFFSSVYPETVNMTNHCPSNGKH
jgi:hypothetical protein